MRRFDVAATMRMKEIVAKYLLTLPRYKRKAAWAEIMAMDMEALRVWLHVQSIGFDR